MDARFLKFKWTSGCTICSIAYLTGIWMIITLFIRHSILTRYFNFGCFVSICFFSCSFLATVLFLRLCREWPKLMIFWTEVDHRLKEFDANNNLSIRLKTISVVVLTSALLEHVLFLSSSISQEKCEDSQKFEFFLKRNFRYIFDYTPFAFWKVVPIMIINIMCTFTWNYMDLFIMLISTALAQKFISVNYQLRLGLLSKSKNLLFWNKLKNNYILATNLCKTVDATVSDIVLLSFANNLFVILVQLFNSLKPSDNNLIGRIYFMYSFLFLIFRTTAVLLYAASVNDVSKDAATMIMSTPPEVYNIVIERFLYKIKGDPPVLTGKNFFHITRPLILHMDAYEDDDWKDSDFESDTESSEQPFEYKPSYILIAIDTDALMFNCDDTQASSAFVNALDACHNVFNSLILANQRTIKGPVGIVLASNDADKSSFVEFEHTIPDTIKLLKNLKSLSNNELQKKYERKNSFDLGEFFLYCKNKLLGVKTEAYKRTLLYITNDDNPTSTDRKKRFKVINESQKFPNIQIQLSVVTFKTNFDDDFYSEVLSASNSTPVEKVTNTVLNEKLASLIQVKTYVRKSVFYPFLGNTESYFNISISRPISTTKVLKNMYVTKATQQQVKKTIKQNIADTYDCIYSRSEPGIEISLMEKQKMGETKLSVGYTLLSVSIPIIQPGWVIKPPYLMEKHSKENLELFDIFWQFCRDKDRCLVCYQKLKKGGDVRLVELIPKLINNKRQFLVKIVPFAPEIHYNPTEPDQMYNFSEEEEAAMSEVIESLTFNYSPECFRDPVESKKKAYIKSQLLEEKMEEVNEGVETDEVVDERLSKPLSDYAYLNLWKESVTNKRSRTSASSQSKKKKKK
ncbi:hypothetical protein FQA39_LY11988 [Lamprigera yunnana]|nr:hypothetical protein FQA39_LY11988 [Lamprigera yunnana]